MEKKLLVVVDMQNDFINGSLPAEGAATIVKEIKQKIEACLQQGYGIVYTMDTHHSGYLQTVEGKNLPILHCQKGSYGWQLVADIYKEGCTIIEKSTFVAFSLVSFIEKNNFNQIEFVGVCTDICVLENALLLANTLPNLSIAVHKNLTAGTTVQKHKLAIQTLKEHGIHII